MNSQIKKTAYRLLLGAFLFSFVVACNSKKDKKEEPPKEDTTKVETPPPAPMPDTTKMDKDTADTRPVKPGE